MASIRRGLCPSGSDDDDSYQPVSAFATHLRDLIDKDHEAVEACGRNAFWTARGLSLSSQYKQASLIARQAIALKVEFALCRDFP